MIYYAALESVILPNNQFLRWFMLKYGIIDSGQQELWQLPGFKARKRK